MVFAAVMDTSRGLQYSRMDSGAELKTKLLSAKVAYPAKQGGVGCKGLRPYSGEAASMLFPGSSPGFMDTFADVSPRSKKGRRITGYCGRKLLVGRCTVYDLIIKHRFYIAAAAEIRVNPCLLAVSAPGFRTFQPSTPTRRRLHSALN